jgi:hypothetical protein
MAPGYGCDFCESANPVTWLITNLTAGSTLSTCADDFPVAMIALLGGELGVDASKFYENVKRFVDREQAKAAKAAPPEAAALAAGDTPDDAGAYGGDDIAGDAVDDEGGMSDDLQPTEMCPDH